MENHLYRRLVPQKELLGIDQIKQIAILVNKSVSLPSALCATLSSPQGISLIVFHLIWTPMSMLVLVLHEHFHLGKSR